MAFSPILERVRNSCASFLRCATLFALLALPSISAADEAALDGADAPELADAIALWLHSDEETALTEISALALDGNDAARLLLGVIDKRPALQGPWLAHLSREERMDLLRQPGGISGRSWLHALSDQPHGAAWLAMIYPSSGPEMIAAFQELGEARAAREAVLTLAARAHPGLSALAPETLDPDLVYLLWRAADTERRAELLTQLEPDDPQRALIDGSLSTATLQQWLASAQVGAPLVAICSEFCASSQATCLSGAYKAMASHNALLILGSPVEALIPTEVFLASPRGRSSVLRRILQTYDARGRRAMIAHMREHDACLSDVLETEAALYRYRRPGSGALETD